MTIHICSPKPTGWKVRHFKCPTCGKRRMLVEHYEWYEPTIACLNCGDEWHGAELSPRPFARGWRKRAVEQVNNRLAALVK